MDLFSLLGKIYTSKTLDWVDEVDYTNPPFLINRWLAMYAPNKEYVKFLNKYTFILNPKEFAMLAWSVIPKQQRTPFVKYIKKSTEDDTYKPLFDKIKKVLNLSDNDLNSSRKYFIAVIEKNKEEWFTYFGMDKKFWKQHGLNFNKIKEGGKREGPKGLALFGI